MKNLFKTKTVRTVFALTLVAILGMSFLVPREQEFIFWVTGKLGVGTNPRSSSYDVTVRGTSTFVTEDTTAVVTVADDSLALQFGSDNVTAVAADTVTIQFTLTDTAGVSYVLNVTAQVDTL